MKCSFTAMRARNLLLAGLLAALPWHSAAAKEPAKTAVVDLRYGVALYHYYQQDYLQALSELMVADARGGIRGHSDNPLLINGGVSLAFGMQGHAEQLFQQLLQDQQRPQAVRDAAWFYLGKLQYTRADWAAAEQSFARVSDKLHPDLLAEMHSLQISLQIKKGEYSAISIKQVHRQEQGSWAAFSLYNLFAAHARAGDLPTAQKFLRDLEVLPLQDDRQSRKEYYALLDKTYTAFGYGLLQEEKYAKAAAEFNKVSIDGLASNQALLGYGWAAMAQGKYADAIKAWQLLQKRSLLYIPAQEALVALPFAYEKLNASGAALREYENAEQLLTREIQLLRDMQTSLSTAELLALVGSKPVAAGEQLTEVDKGFALSTLSAQLVDDGQNWLKINNTSIVKTRSLYLRELFMRNEFQTQVLELRDLLKLRTMLQGWQPKLQAYQELLQQKQQLRQQQDAKIARQSLALQHADLQRKRDALQARLERIKDNDDYMALAEAPLRASYARVESAEVRLRQLTAAGQDVSADYARWQLVRGLLLWNAAQQFPGALADNELALAKMDEALSGIATGEAQLKMLSASGLDLQPKSARIQQQQRQIDTQLQQLDAVIAARAELLRQRVNQQLTAHEKRLNRYLAQSHLAVARLYDTALRNQSP